MKKSKIYLCLLAGTTILSLAGCGSKKDPSSSLSSNTPASDSPSSEILSSETKSAYSVTYDLNYEGGTTRTVSVPAGTRATNWRATRSGHTLDGWYEEKECVTPFDFSQYIYADLTLYASWTKNAEKYDVTLDYNYEGAGEPASVKVEEQTTIDPTLIPECPRLGMEYAGWYTDPECQNAWNFSTDVVTGNLTLYAGYTLDSSIERDEAGNIVYDNVVVGVYVGADFGTKTTLQTLVSKFNTEYKDQIKIMLSTELTSQNDYSLRFQQTPEVNWTYTTYYKATDVFALAGLDLSASDYYAGAIKENYVENSLYSVPIMGGVPYLIYNKELMSKYNGDAALPTCYSEYKALLKKAYDGEIATKTDFKSIVTNRSWTFKEGACATTFFQNDAPYYVYKDGAYVNEWNEGSETLSDATTAMQNFYDLFGAGGYCGGGAIGPESEYYDTTAMNKVQEGSALAGLINIPASSATVIQQSAKMGVLPISGLFADKDKTAVNAIPLQQVGFEFYKAKNVGLTQLAAAAKFVDYVSRNSGDFGKVGWYPLRKDVVESADFQNSTNSYVQLLKQIGDPENFITFDGHVNEKNIFNQTAAEGLLLSLLDEETDEMVPITVDALKESIVPQL